MRYINEEAQMKILKSMQKVPGGMMVIPLLLGAIFNTLAPNSLMIGGFTTALFKNGASALIGLFMLCNGAMINVRVAGKALYKGVVLTAVKFFLGALIGWGLNRIFGPAGILAITPLAVISAMTNSNGGMYVALAGEYGDSSDVGANAILAINDGPFLTMVALGASGMASIPFINLVAVIVPLIIGFILGNLDEDMRKFLSSQASILIPFFAFPLGASLNFRTILSAGLGGIILGIATVLITGIGGFLATRLIGKKLNPVGAAVGTTAGNAAATPAALGEADPSLMPYVPGATAQVAASVIITAILCPLLTAYLSKKSGSTPPKETQA
jgi:2-keto-3-deoxygluconate permease